MCFAILWFSMMLTPRDHHRLDDVYVPVSNLIGKEGEGMKQIMVRLFPS